jgi:hypothetical protein
MALILIIYSNRLCANIDDREHCLVPSKDFFYFLRESREPRCMHAMRRPAARRHGGDRTRGGAKASRRPLFGHAPAAVRNLRRGLETRGESQGNHKKKT